MFFPGCSCSIAEGLSAEADLTQDEAVLLVLLAKVARLVVLEWQKVDVAGVQLELDVAVLRAARAVVLDNLQTGLELLVVGFVRDGFVVPAEEGQGLVVVAVDLVEPADGVDAVVSELLFGGGRQWEGSGKRSKTEKTRGIHSRGLTLAPRSSNLRNFSCGSETP